MAKVLVGYELGGGHGHVHRLMPVIRGLEAAGHEVLFFLRNIKENAVLLAREKRPILPVPDMVEPIPGTPRPAPIASYLDIMCHSGFYRRQSLHAGMLAWRGLIDQVDPDLVVCDHSPICILACFRERPVVQVADGFTLPPAHEENFPIYRRGRKPMVDPAHALQVMQYVQERNGRPVPESVTEPFRTAGRLVCTLPELDPYAGLREDPVIGPVEGLQQPLPLPEKAHFFAYVSLEHRKTKPFLRGLRASSMPGEIFARGMTDDVAKALERPGLTVHREPQPMDQVMQRTSLIIHHGGNGTCCAALSAGRAQLTLPTHMEARLSGEALAQLGVGRLLMNKDLDQALPPILDAVASDSAMAARAQALAADIQARQPLHTVERILTTCLEVLKPGTTAAR